MKQLLRANVSTLIATSLTTLILAVIPFHAFLSVWLSTLTGHYTLLRLWKEVLLAALIGVAVWLLLRDGVVRQRLLRSRLSWLLLAFTGLQLVAGLLAYLLHTVSAKALGYGLIVNLRFVAFFFVAWTIASTYPLFKGRWQRLLLFPAIIVVVFGLLQEFVLPQTFLAHFGYDKHMTIAAFETVDNKATFIRAQSTLRGANPLGGYLLLIITTLVVTLLAGTKQRRYRYASLGAASVLLVFTYSRSALLGTLVSVFLGAWFSLRSQLARQVMLVITGAVVVIAAGTVIVLRNNDLVQNTLFHTDEHSSSALSSNTKHAAATREAITNVLHEPLGRGPGTAGPASVYNHGHRPRIAENYFLQVGQETGWLGLTLFVLILIQLGFMFWHRRADPLAVIMFSTLFGYAVVGMFWHVWTDDTLAYLWWGLAGITVARVVKRGADDAVEPV